MKQKVRIKKQIRIHAICELKLNGISKIDGKPLSSTSNSLLFGKYREITGKLPHEVLDKRYKVKKLAEKARIKASMEERQKDGFVYFIGNTKYSFVKIGYSKAPEKRIKEIQVGCPFYLELMHIEKGTMTDERKYHRMFTELRTYGEWFRLTGKLSDYINSHNCLKTPEPLDKVYRTIVN